MVGADVVVAADISITMTARNLDVVLPALPFQLLLVGSCAIGAVAVVAVCLM